MSQALPIGKHRPSGRGAVTRVDWLCIAWVVGLTFAMCVYAMPNWEEPSLHVVKVKQVPTFIPKPTEVKR